MTSDHFPVCGYIPSTKQNFKNDDPLKVPRGQLPKYAKEVSQWVLPLPTLSSAEDIEKATKDNCNALQDALKAVDRCPRRGNGILHHGGSRNASLHNSPIDQKSP